jgi:hypothetical protein
VTRDLFAEWISHLEARHLAELTFPEVSRALRALSSAYVERRRNISEGGALAGTGKRAAFALFYGPLHFLLVEHIARSLPATPPVSTVVDLGCGTGAAGAGWAQALAKTPRVVGIDRHPWAVGEAAKTYRAFGITASVRRGDAATAVLPEGPAVVLAAFTLNELEDRPRDALLTRLVDYARRGNRMLVVEPLARAAAPWWKTWQHAVESAGGRADQWRLRTELPPIVAKLDRAAGLDHHEITGRSLWLAG